MWKASRKTLWRGVSLSKQKSIVSSSRSQQPIFTNPPSKLCQVSLETGASFSFARGPAIYEGHSGVEKKAPARTFRKTMWYKPGAIGWGWLPDMTAPSYSSADILAAKAVVADRTAVYLDLMAVPRTSPPTLQRAAFIAPSWLELVLCFRGIDNIELGSRYHHGRGRPINGAAHNRLLQTGSFPVRIQSFSACGSRYVFFSIFRGVVFFRSTQTAPVWRG
jgi:hypothetical protein